MDRYSAGMLDNPQNSESRIGEVFLKLGIRNVHHKRNKMTPVGLGTITTVLSLVLS